MALNKKSSLTKLTGGSGQMMSVNVRPNQQELKTTSQVSRPGHKNPYKNNYITVNIGRHLPREQQHQRGPVDSSPVPMKQAKQAGRQKSKLHHNQHSQ